MIPTSIVVNNKRIGIIGLEGAISSLLKKKDEITPAHAAAAIFEAVRSKNYIPSGLEGEYIKGIECAWKAAIGFSDDTKEGALEVKILGSNCLTCNRLEHMVRDCLDSLGISADIIHIQDQDEIWRHGVIHTPALLINNKIVSQGRLPTMAQLKDWFSDSPHSGVINA